MTALGTMLGTCSLARVFLSLTALAATHGGCSDTDSVVLVAAPTEVMTEHGPVRGTIANGAVGYLGIPYAAAPTGNLRWAPPAAPTPWTETLDADTRPRACPQVIPILGAQTEEDCLFINVHVPLDVPEPPVVDTGMPPPDTRISLRPLRCEVK